MATRGRELGVPARAQALAVTAALAGDVSPGKTLERFYRRLDAVPRWATLPPTVAVHRALGTPDPFAYEAGWTRAVTLLSTLSAGRGSVASLVSTAGRAPSRCYVAASDAAALPLPPGSSYGIKAPRAARVADVTGSAVRKAAATELSAPCGTPVVAATAGTVQVVADEDAGPWLIKVRQPKTGVTTWYAHVQAPRVRSGESVLVGQQLAEVGDLGTVTSCSLGLTVTKRADGETRALDALPYLVGRGAAVSDQPTRAGDVVPGGLLQRAGPPPHGPRRQQARVRARHHPGRRWYRQARGAGGLDRGPLQPVREHRRPQVFLARR